MVSNPYDALSGKNYWQNEKFRDVPFDKIQEFYLGYIKWVNELRAKYHQNLDIGFSDSTFDHIKASVAWMEEKWPELVTPESPTQFVQSDLTDEQDFCAPIEFDRLGWEPISIIDPPLLD